MTNRIHLAHGDLSATILPRGATLVDVRLMGVPHSLTLGGADDAAYDGPMRWFGAIVGPVANRISDGRARINGVTCHFPANDGANTLHGGFTGTSGATWHLAKQDTASAVFTLDLPHGTDGFPGNRHLTARFALTGAATLTLTLGAKSDAETLINLANHSYWNLDGTATTAGHRLRVAADHYLPVDNQCIPTGEFAPVDNTPFDFRQPRLWRANGSEPIDHNLCLARARRSLTPVAQLTGAGGIVMDIETTAPGLQIYDGRTIDTGQAIGHQGAPYGAYAGIALETQDWPDAPAHPEFPSILLTPNTAYEHITAYTFSNY
jgi:aldose 1-epimerase